MGFLSGAMGVGSGLMGLFGKHKNPADEANKYISQIPGQTQQYYQPYFDAGKNQLPGLQEQYQKGMENPGAKFNEIGESFQQSPGFKFALQQALQGAGHAAAAGGMAGSPEHEQQNMGLATDLANQDYYNYMKGATDIYGNAMTGAQGMANQGQNAGQSYADMISQALAQQGSNAATGAMQRNQNKSNAFSQIGGGLASMFL